MLFRHRVDVADCLELVDAKVITRADDGVVVHVNGVEVGRSNMPTGTIGPGHLRHGGTEDVGRVGRSDRVRRARRAPPRRHQHHRRVHAPELPGDDGCLVRAGAWSATRVQRHGAHSSGEPRRSPPTARTMRVALAWAPGDATPVQSWMPHDATESPSGTLPGGDDDDDRLGRLAVDGIHVRHQGHRFDRTRIRGDHRRGDDRSGSLRAGARRACSRTEANGAGSTGAAAGRRDGRTPAFDDLRWNTGRALFGFGAAGIVTVVDVPPPHIETGRSARSSGTRSRWTTPTSLTRRHADHPSR